MGLNVKVVVLERSVMDQVGNGNWQIGQCYFFRYCVTHAYFFVMCLIIALFFPYYLASLICIVTPFSKHLPVIAKYLWK